MVPSPLAGQTRRRHREILTGIFPGNMKWLPTDKEFLADGLSAWTTTADWEKNGIDGAHFFFLSHADLFASGFE